MKAGRMDTNSTKQGQPAEIETELNKVQFNKEQDGDDFRQTGAGICVEAGARCRGEQACGAYGVRGA